MEAHSDNFENNSEDKAMDSDLDDLLNECIQFSRLSMNTHNECKAAKEKAELMEEEMKKYQEKERETMERLRQTQQLVETQLEHIETLQKSCEENAVLKSELKNMEITIKMTDQALQAERQKFEDEKKALIAKYENEATHLLMRLDSQDVEHAETLKKVNEEHVSNCNEYVTQLAQKTKELKDLTAKHTSEMKKLRDLSENWRTENFSLKEQLRNTVNNHQMVISKVEWSYKSELESCKNQVAQLKENLKTEVLRNTRLNAELQRIAPSSGRFSNDPRNPQFRDGQQNSRLRDEQSNMRSGINQQSVQFRDESSRRPNGQQIEFRDQQSAQFRDESSRRANDQQSTQFRDEQSTRRPNDQQSELRDESSSNRPLNDQQSVEFRNEQSGIRFRTEESGRYRDPNERRPPPPQGAERSVLQTAQPREDIPGARRSFSGADSNQSEKSEGAAYVPPLVKKKKLFSEKENEFF